MAHGNGHRPGAHTGLTAGEVAKALGIVVPRRTWEDSGKDREEIHLNRRISPRRTETTKLYKSQWLELNETMHKARQRTAKPPRGGSAPPGAFKQD